MIPNNLTLKEIRIHIQTMNYMIKIKEKEIRDCVRIKKQLLKERKQKKDFKMTK